MKLVQFSRSIESFRQIGAKLLIVGTIPLLTVLTAHAATPGDTDIDGDGIPNSVDIDDDNDGILDTEEGSSQTDDIQDADGNGLIDVLEPNNADPELGSATVRTGLSGSACSIGASSGGVSDPLLPLLGLLAAGGVMMRRRKAVLIKR